MMLTNRRFWYIIKIVDKSTSFFRKRYIMLERFEKFTGAIYGIYRSIQKIESDVMERYGLKGSLAQYLVVMSRFKEGITSARLCEICEKDKAAVSRAVSEMEREGLIARRSEGTNLYRAMLTLTEKGENAAQQVCEMAAVAVESAGKGLDEESRKELYQSLDLIAANLKEICKDGITAKG